MEAIYGLALLSASVLLLAFAARYRNGPNAPQWFKSGAMLQVILFATVTGLVFGISMFIQFVANIKTATFGVTEIAFAAAVAVGTVVAWRLVKAMPKPVAATAEMPPPANTDGPLLQSGRKAGATPRKAA